MSTCKFKVGDRVICVDNDGYTGILTKGKEYVVTDVMDKFLAFVGDTHSRCSAYSYRFSHVRSDTPKDVYYGTINFTKLEARLKHLSEGGKLLMKDGEYNSYLFYVDPTTNVILSNYLKGTFSIINEGEYLLMGYGDWYIYEEPTNQSCPHCLGKGTIPISKALIPI